MNQQPVGPPHATTPDVSRARDGIPTRRCGCQPALPRPPWTRCSSPHRTSGNLTSTTITTHQPRSRGDQPTASVTMPPFRDRAEFRYPPALVTMHPTRWIEHAGLIERAGRHHQARAARRQTLARRVRQRHRPSAADRNDTRPTGDFAGTAHPDVPPVLGSPMGTNLPSNRDRAPHYTIASGSARHRPVWALAAPSLAVGSCRPAPARTVIGASRRDRVDGVGLLIYLVDSRSVRHTMNFCIGPHQAVRVIRRRWLKHRPRDHTQWHSPANGDRHVMSRSRSPIRGIGTAPETPAILPVAANACPVRSPPGMSPGARQSAAGVPSGQADRSRSICRKVSRPSAVGTTSKFLRRQSWRGCDR